MQDRCQAVSLPFLGQLSLTGTGDTVQSGWEDRPVNIFWSQQYREKICDLHQIIQKDESVSWLEGQMCVDIKKQNFQEWKDLEAIRRDDVGLFCLFV